jgi:hypothetical protein
VNARVETGTESGMKKSRAECPNTDNASKRTIHGRKQEGVCPWQPAALSVILSLFVFQDFFYNI